MEIEDERQKALRFRKVAEPALFAGLSLDKNMITRLKKTKIGKPTKVTVGREDLVGAISLNNNDRKLPAQWNELDEIDGAGNQDHR